MEYLLQNHFVEGDGNEILEEIDSKIEEINLIKINDMSIESGLEGLFYYASARIKGAIGQKTQIPFDLEFKEQLSIVEPDFDLNNILIFCDKYPISFDFLFKNNVHKFSNDDYLKASLGLKEGLCGMLLKNIVH